jgi:membrane protein required for colicin V production
MPSYLDLAVLAIVLLSALLALLRGFTREVLAIFSWVAAGAIAYFEFKNPHFLEPLRPYIAKDTIARAVDTAGVFFIALFAVSIITVKLSDVILDSKIGALDRTLGFVFGLVRGFLIAVVTFVFYGWLVPDQNQPSWVRTARTKPLLEATGEKLRDMVPQDIEAMLADLKAKKGASANEEPPPESDAAPNAASEEPKRSEAPVPSPTVETQPTPAVQTAPAQRPQNRNRQR